MVDYDSDSGSDATSASDEATPTTSTAATPVEWLATGRAKRSTAGNRMKSMLAHEDPDSDLELLFAEDDDDAGFTDVEDGASDVHMDSSSDSEDDAAPNGGTADQDLAGEHELERQAKERRAAQRRKRKANDAIPAKFRKKVRITADGPPPAADATTTTTTTAAPRPKKKSERTSWLPTVTDMPTRASARQTTVLSKEQLHNQMVEREAKRLKQVAAMEKKAKRLAALKKPPMTQAERLAEAALVEKRNAKSLNRWEEAEKAREEERAAKLAALNNRTLKGPVITFWSGMGQWEGDANGGKTVTMEEKQPRKKREKKEKPEKGKAKADRQGAAAPETDAATPALRVTPATAPATATTSPNTPISAVDMGLPKLPETSVPPLKVEDAPSPAPPGTSGHQQHRLRILSPGPVAPPTISPSPQGPSPLALPAPPPPPAAAAPLSAPAVASPLAPLAAPAAPQSGLKAPVLAPPVLAPPLGGIHLSSSGMNPRSNVLAPPNTTQRPSPLSLPPTTPGQPSHNAVSAVSQAGQAPSQPPQQIQPAPAPSQTQLQPLQPRAPAAQPPPLQTQLEPQPGKGGVPSQKPAAASQTNETTPASSTLPTPSDPHAPQASAQPAPPPAGPHKTTRHAIILQNFAEPLIANKATQSRVLFGPHRKLAKLAKPPAAPLCAITNHPARYRDPHTGLPYFNAYAYREIQRLRRGEYRFSALVGAWVGSCTYAAKGVPVAFLGGPAARAKEKEAERAAEEEKKKKQQQMEAEAKEKEKERLREAEQRQRQQQQEQNDAAKQVRPATTSATQPDGAVVAVAEAERAAPLPTDEMDVDVPAPVPAARPQLPQQLAAGTASTVPPPPAPSAPSAETPAPAAAAPSVAPPPAEQGAPAPAVV
ncbi:uncharacterized protein VDAG_03741 [Verticillium dahliae VdLs.17]|uniref:Vps72/YL1 C-terminal domain-containing protein n=1 Tax=Verticillium dahliae (strain VdLs.17 / ATCC MYA-4575 / FGSC 10137) TaxID=498257 RepID=G2X0G2_VERDV|nr:uncharacterized protein VDAG_03741 [Verticillium dahliae VdLs.17]EGY22303.1 hypothetical protein VDAG_03741 [Verticillium dahliae VdLs.17]